MCEVPFGADYAETSRLRGPKWLLFLLANWMNYSVRQHESTNVEGVAEFTPSGPLANLHARQPTIRRRAQCSFSLTKEPPY